MNDALAARLLTSIENDRLVVLSGAGVSMAGPSRVPSAFDLAQACSARYLEISGSAVPAGAESNLEQLADYFLDQHTLATVFLDRLVLWGPFRDPANGAHFALADFLGCSALQWVTTANVDVLVESAAQQLGEPDFRPSLDGIEATRATAHKPYVKLHGCMNRDRDSTVWTRRQLNGATANPSITTRLGTSSTWLRANLVNRDVIFIGFWSDWAYLNDVLRDAVVGSAPSTVLLVDPATEAVLEAKAPELWRWCHGAGIDFVHVAQSGSEFLQELRMRFSQRFLDRVLTDSLVLFDAMSAGAARPASGFNAVTSIEELYQLRKDLSGTPSRGMPREKRPQPSMRQAGAVHLLVRSKGGVLRGARYALRTSTIRIVNGGHQPMNRVRADFSTDIANAETETVICSDTFDDGGAPSNLLGRTESPSIVRSVGGSTWLTWEQARVQNLI